MKKSLFNMLVALFFFGSVLVGCDSSSSVPDYSGDQRYFIYQLATQDGYTGTYEQWLESIRGKDGQDGANGQDGHSPIVNIGEDGYWYIDNVNTYVKARGENGAQGEKGETGEQGPVGPEGPQGKPGEDGQNGISIVSIALTSSEENIDTYTITYSNGTTSTFTVTNGINGENGSQGIQGNPGSDGHTPVVTIGENGDWFVDGVDTSVKAQGPKGEQGIQGPKGDTGATGEMGPQGEKGETGVSITNTFIDEKGDLIVEFSNGLISNAGHVKDVDTYTVNFYVDDDLIATREVLSGHKISRPTEKETAGYSVAGWHIVDCGVNVDWIFDGYFAYTIHDDIDLYADFEYNEYTISFVDKKHGHHVDNLVVIYDHSYVLPLLEQPGYTFAGWIDSDGNVWSDSIYSIPRNVTLYAVWDANIYSVTLDTNGGNVDDSTLQVAFDSQYTLPTPTRLNYVFLGWYDGDKRVSSQATWKYSCDITLTARWTNINNTYVFDAKDGSCDTISMVIGWEDEYTLPTPTCPEGFTFDGWYLGDTYISQSGTWTYSNVGGTLMANYIDKNIEVDKNGKITKKADSSSYLIPGFYHGKTTFIGDYAFSNCSSLTSITISDSVTSIGNNAFKGCYRLVEVINKSSLSISAGSTSNGYVAYYAKQVITDELESKLSTDESGFITYNDGTDVWLVNYIGKETNVIIPSNVTKINQYVFYNCSSLTSITIPDSVTSIGSYAFDNCSNLKSIIIPDSIVSIGKDAFYNCSSITSIVIPDSVTSIGNYAFDNCSNLSDTYVIISSINDWLQVTGKYSLVGNIHLLDANNNNEEITEIVIPDSVTSVGSCAFEGCSKLTSITIPDSVTSVGSSVFSGCSSLTSITLPFVGSSKSATSASESTLFGYIFGTSSYTGGVESKQYYGKDNDCKTYYIPSSLKTVTITGGNILYGSFYHCSNLTSVTIGNGVTSIGIYAFSNCSNLKSIIIPDSVTFIGNDAFYNCSSLTSVTIGNGVTSIGDYAFYSCSSLKSVTIGNGVTSIGNNAFRDCSSLTSVTIGNGVTSIGNNAFRGCSSLTSIIIPDSVTSIGKSAFEGCSKLTSIIIPDSVTSIGSYAFYHCSNLTSVTIGNGVTSICDHAFWYCSSLTSITIPDSVTLIGYEAFKGCSKLTSIIIPDSVTSIGSCAFSNSNLHIYCRSSSKPSRWDSDWNDSEGSVVWGYKGD